MYVLEQLQTGGFKFPAFPCLLIACYERVADKQLLFFYESLLKRIIEMQKDHHKTKFIFY